MFDHIPVGVGSKGIIPMNARDLEEALEMGMDWSLREGIHPFVIHSLRSIIGAFLFSIQAISGQRIKSTAKSMVGCLMQIVQKYQ